MTAQVGGQAGAHLGTAIAICGASGGFVASAPGLNGLSRFDLGGSTDPISAPGIAAAQAVACFERVGYAGGTGGLWKFGASPPTNIFGVTNVVSLAATPGVPMLVAPLTGTYQYEDGGLTAVPSLPAASLMAWEPGGAHFALAGPAGVKLFQWDNGLIRQVGQVPVHSATALVFGDVHPAAGTELIVGSTKASTALSQVEVYSLDGGLQLQLERPDAGFGASLAIAPNAGGGLSALWIGAPTEDSVYRFVGDAGVRYRWPLAVPVQFGAALAVVGNELVVGAPKYTATTVEEGAVIRGTLSNFVDTPPFTGQPQACEVGVACRVEPCGEGRCVGGVLCVNIVPTSCADGGGSVKDAGSDAGESLDAGPVDAGPRDAGSLAAGDLDAGLDGGFGPDLDAGTDPGQGPPPVLDVAFTACGCHGGWAGPTLLLLLAWSGVRRRGQR